MRDLLIIAVFVGLVIYVCKATNPPVTVGAVNSPVPSVGPTAGENTYPGMAGALYVPVPGSPGQLQMVVNSGFVG